MWKVEFPPTSFRPLHIQPLDLQQLEQPQSGANSHFEKTYFLVKSPHHGRRRGCLGVHLQDGHRG